MKNKVNVSIIIPVFNGRATIRRAISSCLSQTYREFEIIVIDNGSTDGTDIVVKEMQTSRSQLRYVRTESTGRSLARNTGIDLAAGEYIQFLDADDTILPMKLEKSMEIFSKNSNIDAVQTGTDYICKGKLIYATDAYKGSDYWKALCLSNTIPINSMIIKKQKCSRFTLGIDYCEDWNFWLKSLYNVHVFCIFDRLANVYIHDNNTMSDFRMMKIYEVWNYLAFINSKIGVKRSIKRLIFIIGGISIYKKYNSRIDIIERSINKYAFTRMIGVFLDKKFMCNLVAGVYERRFNKGIYVYEK